MKATLCTVLMVVSMSCFAGSVLAQDTNPQSDDEHKKESATHDAQNQKSEAAQETGAQQKSNSPGPTTQQKSDVPPRPWWNQRFGSSSKKQRRRQKAAADSASRETSSSILKGKRLYFTACRLPIPTKSKSRDIGIKTSFSTSKDPRCESCAHSGSSGVLARSHTAAIFRTARSGRAMVYRLGECTSLSTGIRSAT